MSHSQTESFSKWLNQHHVCWVQVTVGGYSWGTASTITLRSADRISHGVDVVTRGSRPVPTAHLKDCVISNPR